MSIIMYPMHCNIIRWTHTDLWWLAWFFIIVMHQHDYHDHRHRHHTQGQGIVAQLIRARGSWYTCLTTIGLRVKPKYLGGKQHELHLWIYYTSKFLNTSEFIIMINSRHILNLSIELIIKPQALDGTSCYKCNGTKRKAGRSLKS
jgi:hypothetical protein